MDDLTIQLACLLLNYEMDEPHVSLPDLDVGDENAQAYGSMTPDCLAAWLAEDHDGDCVNKCHSCNRCMAEMAVHKAGWIAARLFGQAASGSVTTGEWPRDGVLTQANLAPEAEERSHIRQLGGIA